MGFMLGFFPSLLGYKSFCVTINAVETFVKIHYEEQIDYLKKNNCHPILLQILQNCSYDEITHQQDAEKELTNLRCRSLALIWFSIVKNGSAFAVRIAKII
jgi:ubiquinone biosynthesis monooxygenase Coq7